VDYLETIYFAKSISKFDYSLKRQSKKKIYLFDNGYLTALSFKFSGEWGKLLENMVFVELYRQYGENIYFLQNGSETDFIVS
jgi:predicted AAA+ superfamily ATPase